MTLLITYALLALSVSFLCSLFEAAFLSFTPSFLNPKIQAGKNYAITLKNLKKGIDQPLIAILTLSTVAQIVGAILVGTEAQKLSENSDLYGSGFIGIVAGLLTFLILVTSEIIPKTIGATYWKNLGPLTAFFLRLIIFPLKYSGLLWILNLSTKLIGRTAHVNTLSREEILAIAQTAGREGVFEESEATVIKNLLVFKSVQAKDVMTPFSVVTLENEAISLKSFHERHKSLKFSRIPVYKEKTPNITGFILRDDLLEEIVEDNGDKLLSDIKRDLFVVQSQKPIPELFDTFIKERAHIAVVVDEYGNTIGIVTMEDIIETLLGLEIMDESDTVEDMQMQARKNWERRAKRLGITLQQDMQGENNDD